MRISHADAKYLLNDACTRYINHNQEQLNSLIAKPNTDNPRVFFDAVFGLGKNPEPGFSDWVKCEYFIWVDHMLCLKGYPGAEELHRLGDRYRDDQDKPKEVLSNLQGMIRGLNGFLEYAKNNSEALAQQVIRDQLYDEQRYEISSRYDTPFSTEIYLALHQLHALGGLVQALASHHLHDSRHRLIRLSAPQEGIDDTSYAENAVLNATALCQRLEASKPIFDGYLKGVVVKELRESLTTYSNIDGETVEDERWVDEFQSLYNKGHTQDILKTQRQSKCEYYLKILSVISILIGVGIFTTIGLSLKRLYDTDGKSMNFFKPLSATLNEEIGDITQQHSPSPSPQ